VLYTFGRCPLLEFVDVVKARSRIAHIAIRTPLLVSDYLSNHAGCEVLLKLETVQPTGAFKIRGAANAVSLLSPEQRKRGVACCSTGNHGRAVAYAAKRFAIPATVCLSELVPPNKVNAIKGLGARVCRNGKSQDEAQKTVQRLVHQEAIVEIPPFDNEAVVAGQGTIALEMLEDRPDISTLIVPVSGGGLIGGIALAAKAINRGICVIGVSMEKGAAMHESLRAGQPVEVAEVASLADSLGGGIGLSNRITFELCRRFVNEIILLSESEIYRGIRTLFHEDRVVAEGGGAVGAAALLAGKIHSTGPIAVIISGQNTDMQQFVQIANGEPVTVGDLKVKA
jgi:threonine dehydratase